MRIPTFLGGALLVLALGTVAGCSSSSSASSATSSTVVSTASCATKGVPGKYDAEQLRATSTAIEAKAGAQFTTEFQELSIGSHAVLVTLQPGQEALAAQLEATYGDAVSITVGATPYCNGPGPSPACPQLPRELPTPPGVTVVAVAPETTVVAGKNINASLRVSTGPGASYRGVVGDPQPGLLVDPGTRKVTGAVSGTWTSAGSTVDLGPNGVKYVAAISGTSLCGGSRGSVVPAGHYDVLFWVPGPSASSGYFAAPVPVTVTKPAGA